MSAQVGRLILEASTGMHDDAAKAIAEDWARIASHREALLEALQYARRFLNPKDHDTAFIDAAIAKATGEQA